MKLTSEDREHENPYEAAYHRACDNVATLRRHYAEEQHRLMEYADVVQQGESALAALEHLRRKAGSGDVINRVQEGIELLRDTLEHPVPAYDYQRGLADGLKAALALLDDDGEDEQEATV